MMRLDDHRRDVEKLFFIYTKSFIYDTNDIKIIKGSELKTNYPLVVAENIFKKLGGKFKKRVYEIHVQMSVENRISKRNLKT